MVPEFLLTTTTKSPFILGYHLFVQVRKEEKSYDLGGVNIIDIQYSQFKMDIIRCYIITYKSKLDHELLACGLESSGLGIELLEYEVSFLPFNHCVNL